jgi:hypothetical protein
VAEPVLANLAENKLREKMPIETPKGLLQQPDNVSYLQAFGRTVAGLAPWLELAAKPETETKQGTRLAELARQGLDHATDSKAPDFMNFVNTRQPLVDAAYLSHALLRAPRELWQKLVPAVQKRVIHALQSSRVIKPWDNNWLLFSAMVETLLATVGAEWKTEPIDTALNTFDQWYKGDGCYGDGPDYHWDYCNSFVIHPLLIDILEHMAVVTPRWSGMREKVLFRAHRYAVIQERLIAPDGSYPAVGRSLAYRCGAFQLLAQMALRGELPAGLPPGQVRAALSSVIDRTLGAPGTFDEQGWLRIGLCGHQPSMGEFYVTSGSAYLCSVAFLPLGLPAQDSFWSDPPADWTARKVWAGKEVPADHFV